MKNRTVLQRRVSVDAWSSIRSSWLIISLEQKKRRKVKQQQDDDDEEDDDEEPSSVDNGKWSGRWHVLRVLANDF